MQLWMQLCKLQGNKIGFFPGSLSQISQLYSINVSWGLQQNVSYVIMQAQTSLKPHARNRKVAEKIGLVHTTTVQLFKVCNFSGMYSQISISRSWWDYFLQVQIELRVIWTCNKSPRAQRRSPGYDVQRFKKIFLKLPIAEADKPQGGAIVTRGDNFNNLGKGTLGDTTYQISKL